MAAYDLGKTEALRQLFEVAPQGRDAAWRRGLFDAAPDASLVSFDPQTARGPDGFPYFQLAIPNEGSFTPFCISQLLAHLLQYGLGAVIYPDAGRAGAPGWVFSFGDVLSLQLYGDFAADAVERPANAQSTPDGWMTTETVAAPRQIMIGAPSEAFLPAAARAIIGSYIRQAYGVANPGVALVVDPSQKPVRSLIFNLTAADFGGDANRLRAALGRLRWFLPAGYGLIGGITADSYAPLGG